MRFFIIMGILLLSVTTLLAQESHFKVLAEHGVIQYKLKGEWQALPIGTSLHNTDLIKIESGAYLGLIHSSGKTLSLDKEGTYEMAHLNARFDSKKTPVVAKYTDLYIQSMQGGVTQSQQPLVAGAAVAERTVQNSSRLKVWLPNSVDVFNSKMILRWSDKDTTARKYEVVFKNMFDEVIMTKETDSTKFTLDFADQNIANERLVIVSVNAKRHKEIQSSNYGIKHMTSEEAKAIERELKELKLEISPKETALDKLILASFYEQNNLLADALTNYEYAIALEPHVEAFKTAYDQFKFRNGLGN